MRSRQPHEDPPRERGRAAWLPGAVAGIAAIAFVLAILAIVLLAVL